jgi:hypothetical protein
MSISRQKQKMRLRFRIYFGKIILSVRESNLHKEYTNEYLNDWARSQLQIEPKKVAELQIVVPVGRARRRWGRSGRWLAFEEGSSSGVRSLLSSRRPAPL